jgi:hypothetical protein
MFMVERRPGAMAESATLGQPAVQTEPDVVAPWPFGAIIRDIARGGLAGLAVGVVVGGIGGRVAMRLIALIIPESTGRFTENGNRIGDITLGGSFAVLLFGGLFAGIFVGTIWVVVSPWLPRSLGRRVLAAVLLAIGLGSFGVIQGSNSDFLVLGYELVVVLVLLGLVGLVGASMAVVDAWLDRRLPRARSATSPETGIYMAISLIGALFAFGVVATFLDAALRPVGIALLVTGIATLRWWYLRFRGAERPPPMLRLLGSGGVIAAVVLGLLIELPHIRLALGIF